MDRVSKAERELVRKMQRTTNYGRIISKTPEELAEFLDSVRRSKNYPIYYTDWLEWLKQENKE